MMQPSIEERKLTFVVTTSTGKVYTQTIETNKAHIAGTRYTATLDGLVEATETVDLESFANSAPISNVWIISDGGSPTTVQFTNLRKKLEEIKDNGRKIELIFPNLITIPKDAFSCDDGEIKSLQSVSAPKATKIGDSAFDKCNSLASIYFPNVTSIGVGVFVSCGLVSCDFPKAKTIETEAFIGNSALTSVNLPVVTSIKAGTFKLCQSIKTMTIAVYSTTLQCGDIFGDTDASNISLSITLYKTTVSDDGKSWIVQDANGKTIKIGPFKKITKIK